VIEVLARFRHPFSIITKSALILRDLDMLAPMARREPGAGGDVDHQPGPQAGPQHGAARRDAQKRRIDAVRQLTEAGVPTTVMFAPSIPGLNDHEMEAVLEARRRGRRHGGPAMWPLRLPLEIKDLFRSGWPPTIPTAPAGDVAGPPDARRQGLRRRVGQRMTGKGPVADSAWTASCRRWT
jgi:DNA repair photolyase